MKKLLTLLAAFAMTTLFAQANDVDSKMKAAVEEVMQESSAATAPVEQTDATPAPQEDEKKNKKETTEEK